jgi:hypothetical protein
MGASLVEVAKPSDLLLKKFAEQHAQYVTLDEKERSVRFEDDNKLAYKIFVEAQDMGAEEHWVGRIYLRHKYHVSVYTTPKHDRMIDALVEIRDQSTKIYAQWAHQARAHEENKTKKVAKKITTITTRVKYEVKK